MIHARRVFIAAVTSLSMSWFGMATAYARPAAPIVAEQGLPQPTPLVMYQPAPVEAPLTTHASAAPLDLPIRIPAPQSAFIGKVLTIVLAIIGLAALVVVLIIALVVWDLTTDDEGTG